LSPRKGLPATALERVRDALAPSGRVVRVRSMPGGISSSVHLVALQTAEGERQAVVVRRYGEYYQRTDPAACMREFRLLTVLAGSSFPAPKPLLVDPDGGPFGAPTVVMSRLPGRPLLAPRNLVDYVGQMARTLADLHRLPIASLDFLPDQRDLTRRALATRPTVDDPLQHAVFDAAVAAFPRVLESSVPRALLHGDYWPGNVLWSRQRLVGVIDWEQPRLGDPAKDVATCRGDLTILFGPPAADEFVRHYETASGTRVRNRRFWDLLISTWAVREIDEWASVYPVLGRPELTSDMARVRIRAFAEAALESRDDSS
jgi:aminoglycoside phosphotransferase (APT) family kinase protein